MDVKMEQLTLREFEVLNTSSSAPTAAKSSKTNKKWSTKDFEKALKIKFIERRNEDMDLEFDLIGVDASLANAFRRILLAELPSMAIEKVHIYNNTSIIQDEVLAHRLGLVPLNVDPRLFEYKSQKTDKDAAAAAAATEEESDMGTENDTLEFQLKVRCKKNPNAPVNCTNADDLYLDHKLFTDKIIWVPRGNQEKKLRPTKNPGPVADDILLAKLRPGHEIDLRLLAVKGLGSDHAKFSPVATAFYRLMPEITLNRTVTGEQAQRLQRYFSPGVIKLVGSKQKATVDNPRNDSCSRNVFRDDDLKDAVTLTKRKDHFIFSIESVGALRPETLFEMAVDVLEAKCDAFLEEIGGPDGIKAKTMFN